MDLSACANVRAWLARVQAPGAKRLDFRPRPIPGDPLAEGLALGARLGFLGVGLHTRRRNRVNGHVVASDAQGFSVEVDQSVGNCPQYIQGRAFQWVRDAGDVLSHWPLPCALLSASLRRMCRRLAAVPITISAAAP